MTPRLSPLDAPRLARVMSCVLDVMAQGEWMPLSLIVRECAARGVNTTEASVSARLREARNDLGRTVEKRRVGPASSGCWQYRIVPLARAGEQMELGIA